MSKVLKTVAVVAGAAALIATGIGPLVGAAGFLGMSAATLGTIATVATVVSGVASIGATLLAKKPPPSLARGSITQVMIAAEPPTPCIIGETYYAGVLRYDVGYGATLGGVPNPHRWLPIVYSVGPVEELVEVQTDFAPLDAWYSGYLATDSQLGAVPEASALAPPFGAAPGWDADSKLSGLAAIGWNAKFDKDGKRFASGLPVIGAVWKGVLCYDPRKDSTYPGGIGSHRWADPADTAAFDAAQATWEYSADPGLQALKYALGTWQRDPDDGDSVYQLRFGIGLPIEAIRVADFVTLANVCETNAWTVNGVIFEPDDRWQNLKRILEAGAADPVFAAGLLSLRVRCPQVPLDTITADDLAEGPISVTAMQSYRDRLNTVVPKYRSGEHNWELVAAEAVQVPTYVIEDGEEMVEEVEYELVTSADQAAQLAAMKLVDGRELGPITVTVGPRLRAFRPGECLQVELPSLGLDTPAIILSREIDPATMATTLTLIGETEAKHAYALGQIAVPPPTPALGQTAQERDEIAAAGGDRQVVVEVVRLKSFSADAGGAVVTPPLPLTIVPQVTLGGADIRTSDETHYSIAPVGVSAMVEDTDGDPDKGTVTITAVDALNGWIDFTVTVAGVAQPTIRIALPKATAGSEAGGSSGGSGTTLATWTTFNSTLSASFVAITTVKTVTVGSGETLYGSAPLDYWTDAGGSGGIGVSAKWQHSPVGAGTWTDFDTAIDGTPVVGGGVPEPGTGAFNQSEPGLSAGDYDIRLVAMLDTPGDNVFFAGTATIESRT